LSRNVYITRLSSFLPNEPVANDQMETRLGLINGKPSKARAIVLRSNGIKSRHYALDLNGKPTHTNAQLVKEAIIRLCDEKFPANGIELLGCGTTSPDQLLPSHAAMVHGELGLNPIEILSTTGSCCTGIQAMSYCYLSILAGNHDNAVCTGSEKMSSWMLANKFQDEADRLKELEGNPIIAFEKEFLRWMLSDGAGACALEAKPNTTGISLKIEWIEQRSYANELPVCMYAGATKGDDNKLTAWNDIDPATWTQQSVFSLRQDTRFLGDNIVKYGGRYLLDISKKRDFDVAGVNYFLPHLSSEFFGPKIAEELKRIGIEIPPSKWFYNLTRVGNIGSASAFVMLDELFHSGRLKAGDKILMMIPESARFTYAYLLLTVVEASTLTPAAEGE
jgi:3-oxoacyl-[acyl-carrier-protein] synthase-3